MADIFIKNLDSILLLSIAVMNCLTVVLTYLTRVDIRRVEVQTNSMKDALVASTAEASFAAGGKEERERQEESKK